MVATSLLLWPVAGTGWFYPVVAAVLGAVFLVEAHRMWRRARGTEDLARDPADAAVPRLEPLPLAAVRRRRARPAAALTADCPRKWAVRGNRTALACVLAGTTVGLPTGVQANRRPRPGSGDPSAPRRVAPVATSGVDAGSRTVTSSQVAAATTSAGAEHVQHDHGRPAGRRSTARSRPRAWATSTRQRAP